MSGLGMNRSVLLGLSMGTAVGLFFATSARASCEIFSVPQRFNTQPTDAFVAESVPNEAAGEGDNEETIVIGAQPERRYRVVVLSADRGVLVAIRACVLDAFLTSSRFGSYILAGSFDRRDDAELIGRLLREAGYPARVIFQR